MFKLAVYLRKYAKETILGPFFKFLEAVLELLLPTLMAFIINNGVNKRDSDYVFKMGLLMGVISIFGFLSAYICQYFAARASQGFGTDLRNGLYQHILGFSFAQIDQFGTATLTNRLTNDVNQLQVWVAMMIRLLVRAPLICVGAVIMAMFLDLRLSLILIATIPIFVGLIYVITTKTAPLYRQYQQRLDRIGRVLRENISGVRVIRAFAKTDDAKERFAAANDQLMQTGLAIARVSSVFNPLTSLVVYLAIIVILWQGGQHINEGGLLQGEIVAFISYVNQILYALLVISNLIILLNKSIASAERINEVLSVVPAGSQAGTDQSPLSASTAPIITFDGVSFGYNETGKRVLQGIAVEIQRGETIGIIGSTGSGKSTFVSLIPRFYKATTGTISVNGLDVNRQDVHALRRRIGFVPQQALLFSGTVAENIRWGNQQATDADIQAAAETAQAAEFIDQMPERYQTFIQRGGANLSGGQKQRLTLARALVGKPDILILDDATSALDFATDARLRRALKRWDQRLTLLIVSQRVGVIRNTDRIFVFNDGELVSVGTHDALLQTSPIYQQICASQLSEEEMRQ